MNPRQRQTAARERLDQLVALGAERGLTDEERAEALKVEQEFDAATADLQILERAQARALEVPRPGDQTEVRSADDLPTEYRAAFGAYVRGGERFLTQEHRNLLAQAETRALAAGTNSAGGFTVPPEFRARMIETMKAFGGVANFAEVIDTDSGALLPWPTANDTGNEGAIVAENTQVVEQDTVFGQASIGAFMYTSKMVRVSYQLLQDSAFNIEAWLSAKLGERIGRAQARQFVTGTGTGEPQGLVTGATNVVAGAAGQTVVNAAFVDTLINTMHSIDPAYRQTGAPRWVMHDFTWRDISKLKDADGKYIINRGDIQEGREPALFGYPILIDQAMPLPGVSAKSVLFGDIGSAYLVRRVRDILVSRLDEKFADFAQVAFLGFSRADARVQDANAVAVAQHSAT